MSIFWFATTPAAAAICGALVYRLICHRGPHMLRRKLLHPITVTDAHWDLVCKHTDFTDYHPEEFDDLLEVLQAAQAALGYHVDAKMPPLAQLTAISLWDTSDDDGWDFVMTVDVNPLVRLASLTVRIHPFTKLGHGPGAARAVLNELLSERDLLVSRLAGSIPA